MKNNTPMYELNTNNQAITTRQLAFLLAFFLPMGKLLELPSLLVSHAGGDLLIASFVGSAVEFFPFLFLFLFARNTGSAPLAFLKKRWGDKAARIFCGIYALFLFGYSALPLFDLEKFSHAAFSDTSPTFFIFTPFLFLCGFICTKGLKSLGRCADLLPALFLIPFLGILLLSIGQTDYSRLLPVMEKPFWVSVKAFWKTVPYFSFGGLLLPIMSGYNYQTGDGKKLFPAFGVGVFLQLLLFATFFALFGLFGEKEHFAIMKIGQFFPALKSIGRIDLVLVYLMTVGLFFYTAAPLQLFTDCLSHCFHFKSKIFPAVALSVVLYFCLLFLNKYNTTVHNLFSRFSPPLFLFFSVLIPFAFWAFGVKKNGGRVALNKKSEQIKEEE